MCGCLSCGALHRKMNVGWICGNLGDQDRVSPSFSAKSLVFKLLQRSGDILRLQSVGRFEMEFEKQIGNNSRTYFF